MELPCVITRVAYPPATENGGWYILITSAGCAKGKMAFRPKDGESLILFGEWGEYRGQKEYKFDGARLNVPSNPRDTLRYCVERTSGMGTSLEEAIWTHSGANWKDIKPGAVPRLGGALFERFRLSIEALNQNQVQAEVVGALIGKGCTPNMAEKAFQEWKGQTLGVVNSDPFRLAELEGYGFAIVDRGIRQNYGITDADPRRIKAAVVHTLRKLTDTGSTVCSWQDLFSNACAALGGYDDLVYEATRELLKCGTLRGFSDAGMICLKSDYDAELAIWEYVTGDSNVEEK